MEGRGRNVFFCSLRMWKDLTKICLTSLKLCVSSGLCGSRFPIYAHLMVFSGIKQSFFPPILISIFERYATNPTVIFRAWATCFICRNYIIQQPIFFPAFLFCCYLRVVNLYLLCQIDD